MTDPTLAKADLYDQIKDLNHPKCTSEVISAIFDTRFAKNKTSGMTDDQAVSEAHSALHEQGDALLAHFRRSG